jgi:hypothetical protein
MIYVCLPGKPYSSNEAGTQRIFPRLIRGCERLGSNTEIVWRNKGEWPSGRKHLLENISDRAHGIQQLTPLRLTTCTLRCYRN